MPRPSARRRRARNSGTIISRRRPRIIKKLLADHEKVYSGKISELAPMFNMDEPTFVGFIDGINTSLKTEIDLDTLESDSVVTLDIDFEKLYYNMHEAKASWLYELKEWDKVLSEAKRHEITKQYRASKVFIKENTVRRNDPCPCGSGKKYKNCCGKTPDRAIV